MGGCILWTFGERVRDVHERLELALELSEPIFGLGSHLKGQSDRENI